MSQCYFIKPALIAMAMSVAGCAAIIGTETSFTPWRGEQLYKGVGGAVEVIGGVEFWKVGEPDRPYKIIGLITQKNSADSLDKMLFGEFNRKQIAKIINNNEGDGVVTLKSDRFVSGYTTQMPINEYGSITTSPEYAEASVLAVFQYVVSNDQTLPAQ